MTIKYTETRTGSIKVKLDGKYVGSIVRNGPNYWHYQPKGRGNPPGFSFNTIEAVKRSLDSPESSMAEKGIERGK